MNDMRTDIELLRKFALQGDQHAFASLIRLYINLVHGIAWRKVEDAAAAEEITQNVFIILARKAWQFAPDDSLPAWLHRTTLLEAKCWLRGELRRRRREQTAVELGTTMNPSESPHLPEAWTSLLDEALLTLGEKDRTALLLRYYEKQPFRAVGTALEISEDSAQKRVASAVMQLVRYFQKHGFKTATAAATTAALQNAAAAAPAAGTVAIIKTVLATAPPAVAGLGWLAARLAGLTKVQTMGMAAVLAAIPVLFQWDQTRALQSESSRLQATRSEQQQLVFDIKSNLDHLRLASARLDDELAQASQSLEQRQKAFARLNDWQRSLAGMLNSPSRSWQSDLPFVSVPKKVLKDVPIASGISQAGTISDWAAEFLGMTTDERQKTGLLLGEYVESVVQLAASKAYPTNTPMVHLNGKPQASAKTIAIPALGEELEDIIQNARSHVRQVVGGSREELLFSSNVSKSWLTVSQQMVDEPLSLSLCINPNHPNGVYFYEGWSNENGFWGESGLIPRGKPLPLAFLPDPLCQQFFDPWIKQSGLFRQTDKP